MSEEIQFLPIEDMRYEMVVSVLSETQDWGQAFTGIPEAHKYSKGEGITVAVLDTGLPNHPDLNDNISNSFNCTVGPIDDHVGHSTHVGGIIAALENGSGIIGVAPLAKIVPIKVLGDSGAGNYDSITAGIQHAIDIGADVINMSLGAPFAPPQAVHDVIKAAYDKGIIIVAAAGNDSGGVNFPAKFPEVIAVAAIDSNGNPAPFTSKGGEISVSAPGVGIYSTYLNNQYAILNGTSQASPLVAGICALMLSWCRKNPDAELKIKNTQDMLKALDDLCDPLGRMGFSGKDGDVGLGIPQFANFMPWKTPVVTPAPEPVVPVEPVTPLATEEISDEQF